MSFNKLRFKWLMLRVEFKQVSMFSLSLKGTFSFELMCKEFSNIIYFKSIRFLFLLIITCKTLFLLLLFSFCRFIFVELSQTIFKYFLWFSGFWGFHINLFDTLRVRWIWCYDEHVWLISIFDFYYFSLSSQFFLVVNQMFMQKRKKKQNNFN